MYTMIYHMYVVKDIDLSHKEQWKAAMKQETKLRSAWLKKAKQIFKLPKNRNSNEDYNSKETLTYRYTT